MSGWVKGCIELLHHNMYMITIRIFTKEQVDSSATLEVGRVILYLPYEVFVHSKRSAFT